MEFIKRLKQLLPVASRSFQARMAQLEQEMQAGMDLASQQRAASADMHWAVSETKTQSDFEKHAARYVNPEITALQAFPASEGRILVAGWYGAENLGDELMMRTVIEHIPAHRLSDTWVLLWDNFEYPRMSLDPRVHVIHCPRSLWELQWYADAFDVLVWGGGAIIDDEQFSNDSFNINTGNLFIHLSSLMLARKKTRALPRTEHERAARRSAIHTQARSRHHRMRLLCAPRPPVYRDAGAMRDRSRKGRVLP